MSPVEDEIFHKKSLDIRERSRPGVLDVRMCSRFYHTDFDSFESLETQDVRNIYLYD